MRRSRRPAARLAALPLALLLAAVADQRGAPDLVDEGNASYRSGDFAAAATSYQQAALAEPAQAVVHLNLGDALYRQKLFNEALEAYTQALQVDDHGHEAAIKYNMGNVKYNQALESVQTFQDALAHLEAAISYYRSSLDLDPAREEARYNLELAFLLMERVNQQRVEAQANPRERNQQTSPNRGQPYSERGTGEDRGGTAAGSEDSQQQAEGRPGEEAAGDEASGREGPQAAEGKPQEAMTEGEAERSLDLLLREAREAESARERARRGRLGAALVEKIW
jgi:tetratricopeptide (TPR) repeat protein